MQRVSRVIDFMALPWNGIGLEGLGDYWPRPDFDLLLVRAYIVKITQTRCRAANEAARRVGALHAGPPVRERTGFSELIELSRALARSRGGFSRSLS